MMTRIKSIVLLILYVLLANSLPAFSQRKAETIITKWAEKPVKVDGLMDDWPDSLTLFNDATKLFYSLSNDEENLYLTIRSSSRENLSKILLGGISFTANIESKKKDAPKVTFPVLDRTPGKNRNVKNQQTDIPEMQKQVLSRIKEIKVEGFKEIIDGGISLYNTYGIKAAVAFDANNNLIQEIAIPLSLLNLKGNRPDLVTYNIKINGVKRPSGGMVQGDPRAARGGIYGGQRQGNVQLDKSLSSAEFYIKSKLAIKQ